MKRKQLTAFLVSAMMAVSACFLTGTQAFAAEDTSIGITAETDEISENEEQIDEEETDVESEEVEVDTSMDSVDISDEQTDNVGFVEVNENGSEESAIEVIEEEGEAGQEDSSAKDEVDVQPASAEETAVVAEEIIEEIEDEDSNEASLASDITDNPDKPYKISVNKEYTQTFEKVNDWDCYSFISGGGDYKVKVWFNPGKVPVLDSYDLEERIEFSYSLYGKYSYDGSSPQYMFGVGGTYTQSIYTPNAFDTEGVDYTISGDYVVVTCDIGKKGAGKEVGLVFKGLYKGTYKFKVLGKASVLGKTARGDMFNLANNVKVTWQEVPGAKYYKVYRSGVKNPVIVTSKLVGYDNEPGLVNGQKYTYKIVASTTGKGDSSGDSPQSYSKVMYRLKTVVIRSAKNTEAGKVKVTYDKTTCGDSYVLQYGEREDMVGANTKVILGANNTSCVLTGLKKGKTYYISIRVRKKVNGIDYYTTFGVPTKVTITK